MGTETTVPEGVSHEAINPFVNVKMEIKIDELLAQEVKDVLEGAGSAILVTVSRATVHRLADALSAHYAEQRTSTPTTKQAAIVLKALGISIREEADESQ